MEVDLAEEKSEAARREELWSKGEVTAEEDQELQTLLIRYKAELERIRRLSSEQQEDLKWLRANPPDVRLTQLRKDFEWTKLMVENGVLLENGAGQRSPGPNHSRLRDYEVNKDGLLSKRLRISSQGLVKPVLLEGGKQVPLPEDNRVLEAWEVTVRKNWLFGLNSAERLARLQALERMAYHRLTLSEIEKLDKEYLRELLPISTQTYRKKV